MKQFCVGIIVVLGLTLPAFGQQTVNPEGIYQLNFAKSTINGPPLVIKTQTAYIGKETTVYVGFRPNNEAYRAVFPAFTITDGQPRPVDSTLYDTQAAKQIDPYTFKVVRSKNGKVVEMTFFFTTRKPKQ
jgi:hypothetical protein